MVSNYDMYDDIGHKGSGRHTNVNTWSTCIIWVLTEDLGLHCVHFTTLYIRQGHSLNFPQKGGLVNKRMEMVNVMKGQQPNQ